MYTPVIQHSFWTWPTDDEHGPLMMMMTMTMTTTMMMEIIYLLNVDIFHTLWYSNKACWTINRFFRYFSHWKPIDVRCSCPRHLWLGQYGQPNNVVKTIIVTTPCLMVYTTHKNGDDWGMVYGIVTTLITYNHHFYGWYRPSNMRWLIVLTTLITIWGWSII